MAEVTISLCAPLHSDPDLPVGAGFLTLERSDGRSVWRQRLVVERKLRTPDGWHYSMRPVDGCFGHEAEVEYYLANHSRPMTGK